ncbi:MAG: hypothetical protein QMD03_08820 [Syntrophales bacterium]|nr:hypothetical protein [Syntrophales bacterium]
MMKIVQEKRKKGSERKSIALPAVDDVQIQEISKEFFPEWIVQDGKDWICPICERPHHKEPGPFIYGATVRKNESAVSLWVQSLGCCRWEQCFPFKKIKERKVKASDLIPVLRRSFYSR